MRDTSRRATAAVLLTGLLALHPAGPAAGAAAARAPAGAGAAGGDVLAAPLEDVLGRPVPLGDGRPALVFYANRDTREPLRNHAFDLAYQVRERRPVVVVRVDLRDVPAVFRGVALRQLRRSHHASLRAMADVFRRHGEAPPEGLEGSLFLVAEPDGAPHAALGLAPGFSSALGQAVGPTGEELARADFPAHASELASALEGLAHR